MRKKRLFIAAFLAVLLGGVGYMWWRASSVATLSFPWGSTAKKHLEAFTLPSSATEVSAITVRGPDGPMPEIARQYFTIESDHLAALHNFYVNQCTQFGMHAPNKDILHLEPNTLCIRRNSGESLHFLIRTNCQTSTCLISLELNRITGF